MPSFVMPAPRASFSAALPSTAFHVALLIGAIWGTRTGAITISEHTIVMPIDWASQSPHHTMHANTTVTIPGAPIIDAPAIPDIPQPDVLPAHSTSPNVDHWNGSGMVVPVDFVDTVRAKQIFQESEVDDPPSLVTSGRLRYPPLLAEMGLGGAVTLTFVIDTDGKVDPSAIEILSATHSGFVEAAKEAVGTSRFHPARKHGAAVRVRVRQTVTFHR
jgi:TonB family protein